MADTGTDAIRTASRPTTSGGLIYNLQGQRVAQPQRGLYIKNGRKFIYY